MRELAAPGAVRRFFPFNIRGRTNQIRESYGRDLLEDSGRLRTQGQGRGARSQPHRRPRPRRHRKNGAAEFPPQLRSAAPRHGGRHSLPGFGVFFYRARTGEVAARVPMRTFLVLRQRGSRGSFSVRRDACLSCRALVAAKPAGDDHVGGGMGQDGEDDNEGNQVVNLVGQGDT